MTVYVDDPMLHIRGKFRGYCHMWADGTADTLDELDNFAIRLGLRIEWRQFSKGVSGDFYHYDISHVKREMALMRGAEYMPLVKWIKEGSHDRGRGGIDLDGPGSDEGSSGQAPPG